MAIKSTLLFGDMEVSGTVSASRAEVTQELEVKESAVVEGNIIPNNTGSLGTADNPWQDAYLSSGSLYVGGVKAVFGDTTGSQGQQMRYPGLADSASYAQTTGPAATAPMPIVFNPAQKGALRIQVDANSFDEIPDGGGSYATSRTLVDLTGYTQVRLVTVCTKHKRDIVLAAQWSDELSLDPPEASWNFIDGVNGPRAELASTGLKTDGWVNIDPSARHDVVLRTVASGSQNNAWCDIGMLTLYVR